MYVSNYLHQPHIKFRRTTALESILFSDVEQAQVTYFYCSFGDSRSLEACNVLGSILAQLCKLSNPTYEKVEAWYDQK